MGRKPFPQSERCRCGSGNAFSRCCRATYERTGLMVTSNYRDRSSAADRDGGSSPRWSALNVTRTRATRGALCPGRPRTTMPAGRRDGSRNSGSADSSPRSDDPERGWCPRHEGALRPVAEPLRVWTRVSEICPSALRNPAAKRSFDDPHQPRSGRHGRHRQGDRSPGLVMLVSLLSDARRRANGSLAIVQSSARPQELQSRPSR